MEYTNTHHELVLCIKDALKGRGNLWTNRTTRKHIDILRNKYGYDYQRMENLKQEIFIHFLRTEGKDYSSIVDRYEHTRASLQTYVNIIVLNFVRNRTKFEQRRLEREGKHLSYDSVSDNIVDMEEEGYGVIDYDYITTTPNPEELVIMKEWIEGFCSEGKIFLDYALENIDKLEAMEALDISRATFYRRYDRWRKGVGKELKTQGLVN